MGATQPTTPDHAFVHVQLSLLSQGCKPAAMQLRPLYDTDDTATSTQLIGKGKELKSPGFDEGFLQPAGAMLKDPVT